MHGKNLILFVTLCCFVAYSYQSCGDNLCDCGFTVPVVNIGINACQIPGVSAINDLKNTLAGQVTNLQNQITQKTDELNALKNKLENELKAPFDNIKGLLEDANGLKLAIQKLQGQLNMIQNFASVGIKPIISAVEILPKAISKDLSPKFVGQLKSTVQNMYEWIFEPFVKVEGLGPADCWKELVNNGSITFGVGFDFSASVGVGISFSDWKVVNCLIQQEAGTKAKLVASWAQKGISSADWVTAQAALVTLSRNVKQAVDTFTQPIIGSSFCNESIPNFAIPPITATSPEFVAKLAEGINKVTQMVNPGTGFIANILQDVKDAVCKANAAQEIRDFAADLEKTVTDVNFPSLRDAIINGLYKVIHGINDGVNRIPNTIPTAEQCTATPDDVVCKLIASYGADKLQCFKENLDSGNFGVSFGVSAGLSIIPPFPLSFAIGFGCSTLDCWTCVLSGGIGQSLQFTFMELFKF